MKPTIPQLSLSITFSVQPAWERQQLAISSTVVLTKFTNIAMLYIRTTPHRSPETDLVLSLALESGNDLIEQVLSMQTTMRAPIAIVVPP